MFTRHAQAASPGAPLQSVALGFHWLDDDSPRRWVGHAGAYSFGWAADARYYPHSGLTLCAAQNAVDITRYVQPPDRSAYGLLASFVASWCHDRPAVKPAREPSWERGYVAGLRVADRVTGLAGAGSLGDDAVARMISGTQPPDPQWADGFRAAIEATREIAADPAATERFLAHEAAVPAAFMELEMLAAGGSRATFGPQLYFTR
jgi:hypothetical protein